METVQNKYTRSQLINSFGNNPPTATYLHPSVQSLCVFDMGSFFLTQRKIKLILNHKSFISLVQTITPSNITVNAASHNCQTFLEITWYFVSMSSTSYLCLGLNKYFLLLFLFVLKFKGCYNILLMLGTGTVLSFPPTISQHLGMGSIHIKEHQCFFFVSWLVALVSSEHGLEHLITANHLRIIVKDLNYSGIKKRSV